MASSTPFPKQPSAQILLQKSPLCGNATVYIIHTCMQILQCTVASKFLLLQESVRDAADLYLSLKYPPPLLICDTPCGLARHIDQRCPEIAEQLWGDNVGCFQKPTLGQSPSKVSILHPISGFPL